MFFFFFSLSLSRSIHSVNILSHQRNVTQVLDWITLIDSIYICCLFILTVIIRRVDIHTHTMARIFIASCIWIEIESKIKAKVFDSTFILFFCCSLYKRMKKKNMGKTSTRLRCCKTVKIDDNLDTTMACQTDLFQFDMLSMYVCLCECWAHRSCTKLAFSISLCTL